MQQKLKHTTSSESNALVLCTVSDWTREQKNTAASHCCHSLRTLEYKYARFSDVPTYFFSSLLSVVVRWCCCFLVACDDSCTNECRYEYVHNIKTGIHTHARTWANEWAQHSMGEDIHVKRITSSTKMDLGWVSQCAEHGVRFNAECLWRCTNTTTCWLCAFAAFVYYMNTWTRSFTCGVRFLETRLLFNEFVFSHTTHSSKVRKS